MSDTRNQVAELTINLNSIENRISTILAEYLQTNPLNLPFDSSISIRDTLGLKSLALVSLILRIGDEFEVDITDSVTELNSIITVGDLYSLAYKLQRFL